MNDDVVSFRAPASKVAEWRASAQHSGISLGAWLRKKLDTPPTSAKTELLAYGQDHLALRLWEIGPVEDPRFVTLLVTPLGNERCCAQGHETLGDAARHGADRARELLLREADEVDLRRQESNG